MVILKYLPLKEVLRSPAFFVGSGAGSFQLPKALANCFKDIKLNLKPEPTHKRGCNYSHAVIIQS